MSTVTTNLGLFKYDTSTDGSMPFNINQALNNNWDIIDTALSQSSSYGDYGYTKLSNGLIINYGKVSVGSQEKTWNPQYITENGTFGGSSVAVFPSSTNSTTSPAWKTFDGDFSSNSYWISQNVSPSTLTFYFPDALKVTSVKIWNPNGANYPKTGILKASNDNTNWTDLTTWNVTSTPFVIDCSLNNNFYQYYQFYCLSSTYANHMYIYEVEFTATYITQAATDIVFPCAFTTTDYAYSLAYLNGIFGESYADSMTTTGMHLQNQSNGTDAYYIAIGY